MIDPIPFMRWIDLWLLGLGGPAVDFGMEDLIRYLSVWFFGFVYYFVL